MTSHPLAGKPAPQDILTNIPRLVSAYYTYHPDPAEAAQRVAFGTSGHRGSSLKSSFNEDHILAISQAIVEYRAGQGINGPLYLGMDSHALSEPALATAIEVFVANGVELFIQEGLGVTPTPVISHAILRYNVGRASGLADGVVITPSHNPPGDGGFKYNPPSGGPADTGVTQWIETRANALIAAGLPGVKLPGIKRIPLARALKADCCHTHDTITPYVADLGAVVDLQAVAAAGLRLGVDPLGGAGLPFWAPIAERYGLDLTVVNERLDPSFSFMTVDHDGKIRMDCSSPYAMAGLIALKDRFDLAFGNDPDADRHGIVTRSGLMNPNHYLAAAVEYLFTHRPGWRADAAIGKTLVSSSMIDRVAGGLGRLLHETPVGFKWFVEGLAAGRLGFGGEESAGASFLRQNGSAWSTDKDGLILNLLAAEMLAVTGRDPAERYGDLEQRYGRAYYARSDAAANSAQKAVLSKLAPEMVAATELAGEKITARLTRAPGNNAALGGLKVVTQNGWFAARPSGTEDVYKIYAESFISAEHLGRIQEEAQQIVGSAFQAGGV